MEIIIIFSWPLAVPSRRFASHRMALAARAAQVPRSVRCHASSSSPSKVMKVLYCTGNAGKFREASFVIDGWNESRDAKVEYVQVDADPVEVQGTPEEIGASKVVEATRLLRERGAIPPDVDWVVTEDVGLHLRCLNGFPGPYCKPMLEAIGDAGLWDMMSRYEDRRALVTCNLAAVHVRDGGELDGTPELFVGEIEGAVLGPPRGDVKHGKASWNSVFTPAGHDKTFGELQFHEQAMFSHRRRAILKFLEAKAPE